MDYDLKATVGAELRKTDKERERARSAIKEHELGAKLLLRAHAERDGALRYECRNAAKPALTADVCC